MYPTFSYNSLSREITTAIRHKILHPGIPLVSSNRANMICFPLPIVLAVLVDARDVTTASWPDKGLAPERRTSS